MSMNRNNNLFDPVADQDAVSKNCVDVIAENKPNTSGGNVSVRNWSTNAQNANYNYGRLVVSSFSIVPPCVNPLFWTGSNSKLKIDFQFSQIQCVQAFCSQLHFIFVVKSLPKVKMVGGMHFLHCLKKSYLQHEQKTSNRAKRVYNV